VFRKNERDPLVPERILPPIGAAKLAATGATRPAAYGAAAADAAGTMTPLNGNICPA